MNLYYLQHSSFRDHNFSDFWNENGGGEPVERISDQDIQSYIRASYRPHSLLPGKLEGFPPDFDPIIPLTLSQGAFDSFLRSNPGLPIVQRDYFLSKAFQFLYLAIVIRSAPAGTDPLGYRDPSDVRYALYEALDRISDKSATELGASDLDWWWGVYEDTLTRDVEDVLERITQHLPGASPEGSNPIVARSATPVAPFPMPPGADWSDVLIRFTSELRAEVVACDVRETRNYAGMGFADGRSGLPNQAWVLLRQFAKNRGVIANAQTAQMPWKKAERRVQEIRKSLNILFGLPAAAIGPYEPGVGYKLKCQVMCAPSFEA